MKNALFLNIKRVIFTLFMGAIFVSCEKEELPVAPVDRGGVKSFQVEMGNNYENQVWVDFETGAVVASQNRFIWDIAFEGSGENGYIFLNGGKLVKAALSDLSWEQTVSKTGLKFNIDVSNGNTDSLAIGDWQTHQKVIVIDLGYKESGTTAGFVKLQLISLQNGVYSFRYASLDGSNEKQAQVKVNSEYNTLMFSFLENSVVGNQPKKNEYDLFFTQYSTHLYENGSTVPVDYLVNGALINPTNVSALYLKDNTFEDITEEMISNIQLLSKLDVIGYDWKVYNFDAGVYQVNTKKAFVLKDRKGFLYKFHFIDFYNNSGQKGAPKLEYQKL